jgi:hypothetical protein
MPFDVCLHPGHTYHQIGHRHDLFLKSKGQALWGMSESGMDRMPQSAMIFLIYSPKMITRRIAKNNPSISTTAAKGNPSYPVTLTSDARERHSRMAYASENPHSYSV